MIAQRSPDEIERIRACGRIVALVQQAIARVAIPGTTTLELDALAEETIRARQAFPAFKGYHGFPATICASINAQTVHGIPGPTRLRQGDILTVDVGVQLDGFYGDGAFTMGIGGIGEKLQHLLDTTRVCLDLGIEQARPGNRVSDISHAIQTGAETRGVTVVRQFGGHGIGRSLHEDPHVHNFGPPGKGPRLRAGNVLAIEPILCTGDPKMVIAPNEWTASTRDGSPSAHFEHTVAITPTGPDVLTAAAPSAPPAGPGPEGSDRPAEDHA